LIILEVLAFNSFAFSAALTVNPHAKSFNLEVIDSDSSKN